LVVTPPPLLPEPTFDMSESTYRTLVAWQHAMELAVEIYTFSKTFPSDERFELTQQIRRCAVSVPSNIAEGRGRGSTRDYRRFLHQARGSLYEIETQVALAERLGYCSSEEAARVQLVIGEAVRPLQGLIASVDRQIERP
jgi:four helix bundle protein